MLLKRNENGYASSLPTLFEEFFNDGVFSTPVWKYKSNYSVPAVNVKETDKEYELEVAAPGLNKGDFKINLENDVLTISAETKTEHEEKDKGYSRKEFSCTSFSRSFALPENSVEEEKIEAKYNDGILKIHLPKKETAKAKPVKAIAVS